jgi:Protein of unknown function (DUF2568)
VKPTLLAVRFGLELCLLAALVDWALELGTATSVRAALAVVAPAAFMAVWGLYVAPKARYPLPRLAWIALQLALFALACGALAQAGHPVTGLALGLAAVLDLAALVALSGSGLSGTGAP